MGCVRLVTVPVQKWLLYETMKNKMCFVAILNKKLYYTWDAKMTIKSH